MAAVPLVTTEQFDFRVHRAPGVRAMRHAHRHGEVEVNYLERGGATYLIGGRLARITAGRFCFFWGSVPHQMLHADEDAAGFWYLTVPLAWVMAWELPPPVLDRLLHGELLQDAKSRVADGGRFAEWADMIRGTDRRLEKPALLELEARFRRFALDNPDPPPTPGGRAARTAPAAVHDKVLLLAEYVVAHFREPLTLARIAAAAKLHPNYAANLFRKHCGQTLMQCLTQHRIANAQRLLATTDRKVIDVAAESGFNSLSQFYEAFGRLCGVQPSKYRKQFAALWPAGGLSVRAD